MKLMTIVLASLMLLGSFAFFARIQTAAATSSGTPINTWTCVYTGSWTSADSAYVGKNFDLLVTDFASRPSTVKNYNPNIKIFGYFDLIGAKEVNAEGDWATVNANEAWFIHDSAGNRVQHGGYLWYLMDTGNAGYRQYWSNYVNKLLSTYSYFDGVMADDVVDEISLYLNWGMLVDSSTRATLTVSEMPNSVILNWHSNTIGMLQYIKANLPAGKLIIANEAGQTYGNHDILNAIDGILMEGFMHASYESTYSHVYTEYGTAAVLLDALEYGTSNNKIILAMSGATTYDVTTLTFCYAEFLLGISGSTGYWSWASGDVYKMSNYQSIMDTNIGSPINYRYQSQNVFMRDFTGGKVISNPTSTPRTVSVGSGYTLNGASISSVWLNAYSAAILSSSTSYMPPTPSTTPTPTPSTTPTPTPSTTPTPTPSTTPTPTPSTTPTSNPTVIIGNTNIGSYNDGTNANFIVGTQFPVPQNTNTVSISIYSGSAGANAKMAIYRDNNNAIGSLISQSSPITLVAGINTVSISTTTLTGGNNVWIVILADRSLADGLRFTANSAFKSFYSWRSYSNGFPADASSLNPVYITGAYTIYTTGTATTQ
jgi:hypothetical protein